MHMSEMLMSDKPTAQKINFIKSSKLERLDNSNLAILYENTKESVVKRELVSKVGKMTDKKFPNFIGIRKI